MKKLMFAAAVAALSTATMAADSIVSSTVVGYLNKGLKAHYAFNLTVATFQTVGKEKSAMTLGDLAGSEDWGTGADEVKTLKANGAVDQAYTYVHEADATDWGCPAGWYLTKDINDESIEDLTPYCKNETPVAAGEAFIVLVGVGTTTITIPSAL